jgi:spermidine/putrescine transport system substrate-binding protein
MKSKSLPYLLFAATLITVLVASFSGTSPAVWAQGGDPTPTPLMDNPPTATEAPVDGNPPTLNIYNWSTYIADDTISNFEALYGVSVVYDTYGSNDELYAKMLAGNPGYDIIVPGDFNVQQMIRAGLLEEINLENIPNFAANASEAFKNPSYDPENRHCVSYQWGTLGIAYNTQTITTPITGWADIFNPEFEGRIGLMNSSREQMGALLVYLGKDPNTVERADLEAVRDLLFEYRDNIVTFHDDDGQTKLARGEVDVVFEWSGDTFQLMAENPDIAYVIPKEGSIIWTDNLCIPVGAPNKELAEKFINFIYDARVGASISNYTRYGSPNQTAIDAGYINEEDLNNPAIYPPAEVLENLYYIVDVGDAQIIYDEVFADIRAGIAQ